MKKILMMILSVGMLISANMLNLAATAQDDTKLVLTAHETAVQILADNQAIIDDLNNYANAFPEVVGQVDETELTTYVTEFTNKKVAAEQAAQNIAKAIDTYQKALDVFNASGSAASNSPQEAASLADYTAKINTYFTELDEWLEQSQIVYQKDADYSRLVTATEKMNTFFEDTATTLAAYRNEMSNINALYIAPYTVGTEIREQGKAEGMCSIFTRTDISEVVEMLSTYPTVAPETLHGFADPMQDDLNAMSIEFQQTMAEYKEQIDKYNSENPDATIDYYYPPQNADNVTLNILLFNMQYRDLHYQSMKIDGTYPAEPSAFYESAFHSNYENNAPGIQEALAKFDAQKPQTIAMLKSKGCIDENQNFIDNSRAVGRALTDDDILLFNFMYRGMIGYHAISFNGKATFESIEFLVPVQTGNDKVAVPTVIVPTLNKPIPLENIVDNETTVTVDPDVDPTLPSTGEGSREIIILSTLLVLGSSLLVGVGRRKIQAYQK